MIRILTLLFFITLVFNSHAQQIRAYYQTTGEADSLKQKGEFAKALPLYIKAEQLNSTDGFIDRNLAFIYLKFNNLKKTDDYIYKAVVKGVAIDQLNSDTLIKGYLAKTNFDLRYQKARKIYYSNIEYPDQMIEVFQMLERDQAIRDLYGARKIDLKIFESAGSEIDSANTDELKEIVKKIGFPGYKEIGNEAVASLFTLMLHIPLDGINDAQDMALFAPLIKQQVLKGNFPPIYYALIVDRYNYTKFKSQVFGTYWEYDAKKKARVITSIKDISNVDKLRAEIFLPPLSKSREQGLVLPDDYK
ncbi:DUF6624 domain-containing protein [Mucilaginibacter sp. OK098]|uniref:DUF6624 domain-containing protein n=1 Tax=Mucilaginibacter sp. OK098 TaxID=1855297 RepID=UPI000913D7D2|nr:DUF6624 domain-containing protein [Mucilaginibacter sp. OK098]SHN28641.1 hypothetical protein SAMN05216524_108179 [Mucilaginibacter sp. OK098]